MTLHTWPNGYEIRPVLHMGDSVAIADSFVAAANAAAWVDMYWLSDYVVSGYREGVYWLVPRPQTPEA